MKGGAAKLLAVVIGLNIFFAYIGLYFLPQSESRPPKTVKIEKGIAQEELISIGEEIIFSKGQCMVCHPMKAETGMRAPAIATIGTEMVANAKEKNMSPEAYLFEALVNPDATIAKGYEKMMPPIHKPPTSLNEGELIAVAAFLQSKGSKVTISYNPESIAALQEQIAKEAKRGGS